MSNKKLVHGVGINDSFYPISKYMKLNGKVRQVWICPIYSVWRAMLERCYSAKYHEKKPTYKTCEVEKEWVRFSNFRKWMIDQDWKEKCLDKDILFPGNKIYGPDKCVFVGVDLNSFLTDRSASRGEFPLGVSWHSVAGRFVAQCGNPLSKGGEYLGLFSCPSDAHEAWRIRKYELSCYYAGIQTDQRIAEALRKRFL